MPSVSMSEFVTAVSLVIGIDHCHGQVEVSPATVAESFDLDQRLSLVNSTFDNVWLTAQCRRMCMHTSRKDVSIL